MLRCPVNVASSDLRIFLNIFTETFITGAKMSKLESAMETLLEVFQYYTSKEGDKFKLNRSELKNLVQGEMSEFLEDSRDPQMVKEIMDELDLNLDGSVSFKEFVFVTRLMVYSCSFFAEYDPIIIRCGQMKDGQFYTL